MYKKIKFMSLITVFLITNFCFSVQAQNIVLKYSEMNSEKTPQGVFTKKFAELVEEKTEGRVKIDCYWSSSLVGYDIEPIQAGIADFNQLTPGVVADLNKELALYDSPYLVDSYEESLKIVDPRLPSLERINQDLSKTGIRFLTAYPIGLRHITTTKKPIYSLADTKGLKLRTTSSQLYMETVRAMGASPTPMAFGEVATALVTGLVDGQENPYSAIVPNGLHEIQDYIIETGHIMTFAGVFMNQASWERLSEQDQENMMDAAMEAVMFITNYIQERDAEWRQTAIDAGVTIINESNGLKIEEFKTIKNIVNDKFSEYYEILYKEFSEILNRN